jgi:uncharacterized protein YbjT (DUF2867 family)
MAEVPTVFVSMATGTQGGAICSQLLALGWNIRGMTRNLSHPTAQGLIASGVHLSPGDWDDDDALRTAMAGCSKLFMSILPDIHDMSRLTKRASRIIRVAQELGISQVVASTTIGVSMIEGDVPADLATEFFHRHLYGKQAVEKIVADGGFEHYTILRPCFFMANFLLPKADPKSDLATKGYWSTCMTPDSLLSLIDHHDIARFVIGAFQDPKRFHALRLGLASEEIPVQVALDHMAEAIGDGRKLKALFKTDDEIAETQKTNPWAFFSSEPSVRHGSDYTNLKELEELIGPLTTFKQFLERESEAVKATFLTDVKA